MRGVTVRETIDAYLNELALSRSAATVSTYASGLASFQAHLKQAGIDAAKTPIMKVTAFHLIDYPAWLKGEHFRRSPNAYTIGTYVAVISGWLRYLMREKLSPDLAAETERIREAYRPLKRRDQRLPRAVKDSTVEKLVKACHDAPRVGTNRQRVAIERDLALIEMLRTTGGRISELLGAAVEDLDARQRTLRVLGKGRKERLLFIDETAWREVSSFLRAREGLNLTRKGKTTPLFCSLERRAGKTLKSLSHDGAQLILDKWSRKAGIRERVTAHKFRHRFGAKILEATGDLAATQDLMGHASPATTRIYARLASTRLREAHRKAFPG